MNEGNLNTDSGGRGFDYVNEEGGNGTSNLLVSLDDKGNASSGDQLKGEMRSKLRT